MKFYYWKFIQFLMEKYPTPATLDLIRIVLNEVADHLSNPYKSEDLNQIKIYEIMNSIMKTFPFLNDDNKIKMVMPKQNQ